MVPFHFYWRLNYMIHVLFLFRRIQSSIGVNKSPPFVEIKYFGVDWPVSTGPYECFASMKDKLNLSGVQPPATWVDQDSRKILYMLIMYVHSQNIWICHVCIKLNSLNEFFWDYSFFFSCSLGAYILEKWFLYSCLC